MVQNTVERGRDKAAQSVQNSESYEEIGRGDQNLPKRVIFLFAPSVLQTARWHGSLDVQRSLYSVTKDLHRRVLRTVRYAAGRTLPDRRGRLSAPKRVNLLAIFYGYPEETRKAGINWVKLGLLTALSFIHLSVVSRDTQRFGFEDGSCRTRLSWTKKGGMFLFSAGATNGKGWMVMGLALALVWGGSRSLWKMRQMNVVSCTWIGQDI
ncbi:hypothetical protein DFH09DRAFT_1079705 [Mycena vulgaris]|nr:hypothetical protein DFH09DRAFT_1079705 [Mycena vulgaris]